MIDRDGKKRSVWQIIDRQNFLTSNAKHQENYDVIVVGAGITGISTALRLQQLGFSCLLVEAHTVGYGTTGGTSAHLNTVLDTPYTKLIELHGREKVNALVRAVKQAWTEIERNVRRYQIECDFKITEGCIYATKDQQVVQLEKIREAIDSVGIPVSDLDPSSLPVESKAAIQFGRQGSFHPLKYIFGLLRVYLELGGELSENTCIGDVVPTAEGRLIVRSSHKQNFIAKKVVYATHTPPGIQLMNFRLVPYRSYIQVFDLSDQHTYWDQLMYDLEEPFHYFRAVWLQNRSCLMVGGQDHKTAHHTDEAENFRDLETFVRDRCPVGTKLFEWSSQFYESQDYLPFIGKYPNASRKNEFLATGFGGNGMIFGTLSALVLGDLIQGKANEFETLLSPSRVGPMKSLPNIFSTNIGVVKRFVGDRFTSNKFTKSLNRGKGAVVNIDGDMIGVAKTLDGRYHFVDAVCRHAGCVVQWNTAEQSWDCPCHGARYAPDGTVLNGPAVLDLKQLDISPRLSSIMF